MPEQPIPAKALARVADEILIVKSLDKLRSAASPDRTRRVIAREVMWTIGLGAAVAATLWLSGCTASIDTRGATSTIAGRCSLMAHREHKPNVGIGLIGMAVAANAANQDRQELYDSCLMAAGSRESPAETLPEGPPGRNVR